jgi:hypothetical protein
LFSGSEKPQVLYRNAVQQINDLGAVYPKRTKEKMIEMAEIVQIYKLRSS